MKCPRKSEEGAALLAVLMLVAVMSAVMVIALERLKLSTHLAANGQALDQARAYAVGAEGYAALRVDDLVQAQRKDPALGIDWNGRVARFALPGGIASARISDGGNCFNLNSVVEGIPPQALTVRPVGVDQFVALGRMAGLADSEARTIAAALVDWIDSDSVPQPGGAEDDAYMRRDRSHRTAGTLLSDPSELRGIAGVSAEAYALLRPWVCALPTSDLSPLNVNTLRPEQSALIAMLAPGQIDQPLARSILEGRPAKGWASMVDFWRVSSLQAIVPSMEVQNQPQLRTRWFTLDLDVELPGAQVAGTALIDGGLSPARVVARSWGGEE